MSSIPSEIILEAYRESIEIDDVVHEPSVRDLRNCFGNRPRSRFTGRQRVSGWPTCIPLEIVLLNYSLPSVFGAELDCVLRVHVAVWYRSRPQLCLIGRTSDSGLGELTRVPERDIEVRAVTPLGLELNLVYYSKKLYRFKKAALYASRKVTEQQ